MQAIEYGLMASGIAVAIIVAVGLLGPEIQEEKEVQSTNLTNLPIITNEEVPEWLTDALRTCIDLPNNGFNDTRCIAFVTKYSDIIQSKKVNELDEAYKRLNE